MTIRHSLTIGVDPGKEGAIACLQDEDVRWIIDMPMAGGEIATPLLDQMYDSSGFGPWCPVHGVTPVGIERVHSMPKQGVASVFTFGKAYGIMLGYFAANGHRIHHINPGDWKKALHLTGKDKDAARLLAIELWPADAQLFARKKDVGRADAALIALHTARLIRANHGGIAA
jgi:crossover junction endodeoxyribonuclease RuvC